MLGRVRACSLSSLEVLEMERTPSKLPKDDSLSIYEITDSSKSHYLRKRTSESDKKTLLKLQQGSKRDLDESTNTSASASQSISNISSTEASMTVNTSDYASPGSFSSAGNSQPMFISKEEPRGNVSVLYMFSRYKNSRDCKIISSDDCAMAIAMDDCCTSASTSPSSDHELQEGCIVDSPSPI